ncbi:abortive infection family protein [Roseobacteraceae bacterium NS-SX3]
MPKLISYQWDKLRNWFCPEPGYVLDFSNKTFAEFFEDHFEINIYADAFSEYGTSKYNRLRSFIELAPPHVVIELLNLLWAHRNRGRDEEIEVVERRIQGDWSTVSTEHLRNLLEEAHSEDIPFQKLVSELGALPSHVVSPHLKELTAQWTLDTLDREIGRALENIQRDPEAAVTAASSMIESICRSILIARELPLPKQLDIKSLYRAVREPLGLNPKKEIESSDIESDVRAILSAISNAVQGIGALRSHAGTAHGRERGFRRIDPRIARLSVNSASAVSIFLIETWEKQFPEDRLTLLTE